MNRVVSKLQDANVIDKDVDELLQPVYSPTASGYSRALGFRIPADVCALILS